MTEWQANKRSTWQNVSSQNDSRFSSYQRLNVNGRQCNRIETCRNNFFI